MGRVVAATGNTFSVNNSLACFTNKVGRPISLPLLHPGISIFGIFLNVSIPSSYLSGPGGGGGREKVSSTDWRRKTAWGSGREGSSIWNIIYFLHNSDCFYSAFCQSIPSMKLFNLFRLCNFAPNLFHSQLIFRIKFCNFTYCKYLLLL